MQKNELNKGNLLFLLLILLSNSLLSQEKIITGKVLDSITLTPLPFVHIYYLDSNIGTITDINGNFTIKLEDDKKNLVFSFVGYKKDTLSVDSIKKTNIIKLAPIQYLLKEVVITPGPNPANRIIELAIANKEKNNPLNYNNFSCTAYRRFVITTSIDSIKNNNRLEDSIKDEYINFFERYHFFLTESVSEIIYKYPDDWHEKVIDTKISGIDDPTISVLFNQLTPFSFYSKTINIGDKHYLNPINANRY